MRNLNSYLLLDGLFGTWHKLLNQENSECCAQTLRWTSKYPLKSKCNKVQMYPEVRQFTYTFCLLNIHSYPLCLTEFQWRNMLSTQSGISEHISLSTAVLGHKMCKQTKTRVHLPFSFSKAIYSTWIWLPDILFSLHTVVKRHAWETQIQIFFTSSITVGLISLLG